jgi:hypothetical protein
MSLESHLALMPVVGTIEPWQAPARRRAHTHTRSRREQRTNECAEFCGAEPATFFLLFLTPFYTDYIKVNDLITTARLARHR